MSADTGNSSPYPLTVGEQMAMNNSEQPTLEKALPPDTYRDANGQLRDIHSGETLTEAEANNRLLGGVSEGKGKGGKDGVKGSSDSKTEPNPKLDKMVKKDADDLIDRLTGKRKGKDKAIDSISSLAAVSRASAGNDTSDAFCNIKPNLNSMPGIENNGDGTYQVTDKKAYMTEVARLYAQPKSNGFNPSNPLHEMMKGRIEGYIDEHNGRVSSSLPGLHAEVQATNAMLNKEHNMGDIDVSTYRIIKDRADGTSDRGNPFNACTNCTGILNGHVRNISTGVTQNDKN